MIRLAPLMHWKKEPVRDKEKAIAPLAELDAKYVPINITRENIVSLLLEKMASDGASGEIMDAAVEIAEELFPWNQTKSTMPTRPTHEH